MKSIFFISLQMEERKVFVLSGKMVTLVSKWQCFLRMAEEGKIGDIRSELLEAQHSPMGVTLVCMQEP